MVQRRFGCSLGYLTGVLTTHTSAFGLLWSNVAAEKLGTGGHLPQHENRETSQFLPHENGESSRGVWGLTKSCSHWPWQSSWQKSWRRTKSPSGSLVRWLWFWGGKKMRKTWENMGTTWEKNMGKCGKIWENPRCVVVWVVRSHFVTFYNLHPWECWLPSWLIDILYVWKRKPWACSGRPRPAFKASCQGVLIWKLSRVMDCATRKIHERFLKETPSVVLLGKQDCQLWVAVNLQNKSCQKPWTTTSNILNSKQRSLEPAKHLQKTWKNHQTTINLGYLCGFFCTLLSPKRHPNWSVPKRRKAIDDDSNQTGALLAGWVFLRRKKVSCFWLFRGLFLKMFWSFETSFGHLTIYYIFLSPFWGTCSTFFFYGSFCQSRFGIPLPGMLKWPQAGCASKVEAAGWCRFLFYETSTRRCGSHAGSYSRLWSTNPRQVDEGKTALQVEREVDAGIQEVKVPLPAVAGALRVWIFVVKQLGKEVMKWTPTFFLNFAKGHWSLKQKPFEFQKREKNCHEVLGIYVGSAKGWRFVKYWHPKSTFL